MPLPQFVTRRGERLYYGRAFPQELWPITGKSPFALSLRTSDPREALRARPEAERQYHARVDQARAELARRSTARPLNEADAQRLAVQWFREAIDAWAPPPRNEEDVERAVEDEAEMEADAREALALGRDEKGAMGGMDTRRIATELRKAEGLLPTDKNPPEQV